MFPALKDIWDLYMLFTCGPGEVLRPGSNILAGKFLFDWFQCIKELGAVSGAPAPTGLGLENCIRLLEEKVLNYSKAPSTKVPSLFEGPAIGNVIARAEDTMAGGAFFGDEIWEARSRVLTEKPLLKRLII
jgi:hypothetical protein